MKKVFSFMVMLLIGSFAAHAQSNSSKVGEPNQSAVKFDHVVFDFGEIEYASDGNHTFSFKNVSKDPITITNVSTSCGCTTPHYSKEPVLPGKKGSVTAHYDTTRIGTFNKNLTVTINNEQIVLTIKGTVKPQKTEQGK